MIKSMYGFPDYLISDSGEVFSLQPNTCSKKRPNKPKPIGGWINGDGYRSVFPRIDHVAVRPRTIASLVLETFVGPRPPGHQACHGPKGKLCDSLDNLYWGTAQRNAQDRARDGTERFGEKNHLHKLTEKQVLWMREKYISRHRVFGCAAMARKYGVCRDTVEKIIQRKLWKHI